MNARNLGFFSSWHMLTRDKGWIKPVLVLTLIGWIPILGQIVLLGYGLEWARLTAWGVDSAPKQRNVDYSKVLSSGGRAFLVTISLGFVLALLLQIIFPGSLALILGTVAGYGPATSSMMVATGMGLSLVVLLLSVLVDSFLQAAALRATLYDDFTAGWRLDRLFQMVVRDFGGFCKTWLVTVIGAVISGVYAAIVTFVGTLLVMGSAISAVGYYGMSGHYSDEYILRQLLSWGAGPLLMFLVIGVIVLFVGNVITTAMSLVSMNAMGQWFCRFDVNRWGVSGDPLPEGTPHRDNGTPASAPSGTPVMPSNPAAGQSGTAGETAAPAAHVATGVAPTATGTAPSGAAAAPAPVEPVIPLDAPAASPVVHEVPAEQSTPAGETAPATAAVVDVPAQPAADPVDGPAADSVVDEDAAREAARAAMESMKAERPVMPEGVDSAAAAGDAEEIPGSGGDGTAVVSDQPASEGESGDGSGPGAAKQPIPLGPITADDPDPEEEGPISV